MVVVDFDCVRVLSFCYLYIFFFFRFDFWFFFSLQNRILCHLVLDGRRCVHIHMAAAAADIVNLEGLDARVHTQRNFYRAGKRTCINTDHKM